MTDNMDRGHTNYLRRAIGLTLCLSPAALLLISLVSGLMLPRGLVGYGMGFVLVAAALSLLNFHLSFTRPLLFKLRHGSLEDYRHVSGIPMIGTLLVLVGGVLSFGDVISAALGIVSILMDTGGSLWFVYGTWKDTSFWDI